MQYERETLRKLQLVELDILRDIDRVCVEHGIPYFLDSGTALGAKRHGGFIPWDDDVDLGMFRDDYERFLEVAPAALGEGYDIVDPRACAEQAGLFAKVWKRGTRFATEETVEAGVDQGIFVDVFPYDVLHADPAVAKRQWTRCRLWQSASYVYHSRHITVPHAGALGVLERCACAVAHVVARVFLSHDRIVDAFLSWARRGAEAPSDAYLNMACVTASAFPRAVLAPPSRIGFEGVEFPAPADMEAYLEVLYGCDWSTLPPVEARRNHAPIELDFGDEELAFG